VCDQNADTTITMTTFLQGFEVVGSATANTTPSFSKRVLRFAQSAERPCAAAPVLATWRLLYAAACLVRLSAWWQLLPELQDSYLVLGGWGLPPPSPATIGLLCNGLAAVCAALAAGLATRPASVALLLLCYYLAAMDQDPSSQMDSLLLQFGCVNCVLPLSRCWTLGGALRWGLPRVAQQPQQPRPHQRPQQQQPASVQLWSVWVLRALVVKPYAQDALAKLSDGWTWLIRAQPVAQQLVAVSSSVPGGRLLPWVVAWMSCLLDCVVRSVARCLFALQKGGGLFCFALVRRLLAPPTSTPAYPQPHQVPPLLLSTTTRYTLGFPCILIAQLLNWQVLGLDAWWLLVAGGWLVWAQPELLGGVTRSLPAAVTRLFAPCFKGASRKPRIIAFNQQQQQQWSLSPSQTNRAAAAAAAADGDGGEEAAALVQGGAWSSWFLEGSGGAGGSAASGRQRRLVLQQQEQGGEEDNQEQRQDARASLYRSLSGSWQHQPQGGRSSRSRGGHSSPAWSTVRLALLMALALYHVLTPLRFLTYPSRCVWLWVRLWKSELSVCIVLCSWHRRILLALMTAQPGDPTFVCSHKQHKQLRPAWTDEGLIAPWHRHLAVKQGWVYFVLQEERPHPLAAVDSRSTDSSKQTPTTTTAAAADASNTTSLLPSTSSSRSSLTAAAAGSSPGRTIDVALEADPLLGPRSAALIASSPSAALRYAARIAQVAAAAGRPLASLRALSCFGLNGGPHRALYDSTANLLHYINRQPEAAAAAAPPPPPPQTQTQRQRHWFFFQHSGNGAPGSSSSSSAVSQWVHDYDTAPRCDTYASPRDRPGLVRRSRAELAELQAAAGLWVEVAHDAQRGGLRRAVCWDGGDDSDAQKSAAAVAVAGGAKQQQGLTAAASILGGTAAVQHPGGEHQHAELREGEAPCPFFAYMWGDT